MTQLFVETVHERFVGHVIRSDVRPATPEEVQKKKETYEQTGECDHTIVKDDYGWLYDIRSCGICGTGLGTV